MSKERSKTKKRKERKENTYKLVPLFIYKNGPCFEETIRKTFYNFISQFGYGPIDEKSAEKHKKNHEDIPDIDKMIKEALDRDYIILKDNLYHLSDNGTEEVKKFEVIFKITGWMGKNINSAEAASKNTFFIDLILAIMKLLSGFFSGSIALLADGTDAAIDTASALAVYIGIKYKKELIGAIIILIMMYFSAASIGYESVSSLINLISGSTEKLTNPGLVIVIEAICMLAAWLLTIYQRFVGRKTQNIALITQSVDSKNHIFVSLAVIVGAIFSIFNIFIADIIIGALIAVRILLDAIELTSETVSKAKGEEFDYEKYKLPFESKWKSYREKSFQIWILYHLEKKGGNSEGDLVISLKENFKNTELPLLSDFQYSLGANYNFEGKFSDLITPLLKEKLVLREGDLYKITKKGKYKIKDSIFKKIQI